MSDYERESLSALMDGEADDLELRRLLKSVEQDSDLSAQWQRFHLAQAVMHEQGWPVSASLADRVSQAIAQEPALQATPVTGFRQQMGRLAVAACVAIVAVVALQPAGSPQSSPEIASQTASPASVPAENPQVVRTLPAALVAEAPTTVVDPEAQRRLQEYIESMSFDEEEPVRIEHIQDSPLYRLVNDLQSNPR